MKAVSRFEDITDIDQLETIEDELWAREDEHPSEETKEMLIRLYRRMWELQPHEVRYERSIARLLLELGWDLKRKRINYEKARRFFEELIQMKKPARVPIAHYRLGFIHYHNKEWDRAIWAFQRALDSRTESVEPWAKLDESQRVKARARLAMAYKKKSIEVAQKAKALHEQYPDESNEPYIRELEEEILTEEEKPYLCISAADTRPLNERQYRQMLERENCVVLDCTDYDRKYLYVSGVPRLVAGRNLQILKMLLRSRKPIPQWQLEHEIGIRQASVYMNRLREFLRECGLEREAIVANQGYQWIYPDTWMIYRFDDPDYLL